MMVTKKNKRTCKNGHVYFKSSDCLTCPICEQQYKPANGFLSLLSAPARRALENAGIIKLEQLAEKTEKEILSLHGIGPSSIPKLIAAMREKNLRFKKQ